MWVATTMDHSTVSWVPICRDEVSASVWQPKLCSSRHSDSFAFIIDAGMHLGVDLGVDGFIRRLVEMLEDIKGQIWLEVRLLAYNHIHGYSYIVLYCPVMGIALSLLTRDELEAPA